MPFSPLYRISWTMLSGHSGHGDYCLTQETGVEWIKHLNARHADTRHWLELAP